MRRRAHWCPERRPLFLTWRFPGSLPDDLYSALGSDFTGRAVEWIDGPLYGAKSSPVWLALIEVAQVLAGARVLDLSDLRAFVVMPKGEYRRSSARHGWKARCHVWQPVGMMLALLLLAGSPFAFRQVGTQSLVLEDKGKPVYVYNHGMMLKAGFPAEMSRSGYVHPVYAPDGTVITDDFNPDHAHHRGISWMWQVVKVDGQSYDLWTVKGIKSKFVKWTARETKSKSARLAVENGWFIGDRKVVAERVNIVAHPVEGNRRRLDFELNFEAVSSPVEIAGTPDGKKGFGGFCMRFAPRDGGKAATVITTEQGKSDKDGVNEPHRWAAVSGTFQGKPGGARIDDSPSNPGYPANGWLLRHGFGFLNPYFPGLNAYTIQPGKPLKLRYTVTVFAEGVDPAALSR